MPCGARAFGPQADAQLSQTNKMNISLEKTSAVSAVITLQMVKADYEDSVKASLKKFCQKAQMPGFRPGHVPMGMAKKLYGTQAKLEQVNKLLEESLFGYIKDEKLNVLGHPLANEDHEAQDIEKDDDFTFKFDVALAPEMNIELGDKDEITYYDIEVSDEMVQQQIDGFCRQSGHHDLVDAYAEGDILRGVLAELDAEGKPLEGGIVVEKASLMPQYLKNEAQKGRFADAKKNDVITFNPAEAYEDAEVAMASLLKIDKEKVAEHKGDFSFQVDEISRFVPAAVDQELFDRIYGEGNVKSEEEFRGKVKEGIARQFTADSDYKFLLDVRAYAETKVGDVEMPEALLKRIMKENNKDKDEKFVEDNFEGSIKQLKWQLLRDKLAQANEIKVENADIKAAAVEAARFQFMQYGMNNIPEEYLEQYASEMLKKEDQATQLVERCIDQKLTAALKAKVKLQHKGISMEDFQKLFEEKA